MSDREQGVIHHAVIFFDGDAVVKEMLQVEFEAVLDQVVGLSEFAGREIGACFLRINQRLQIVGAVFFLVDFDLRGYVNRSWNVPLEHLLDNAGRGPDLGGGRIRLSCRSQCSIPWHSRQLWDPNLDGENNSLQKMMQALQRNRLGLAADVPEMTDTVEQPPLLHTLSNIEPVESIKTKSKEKPAETERQIVERVNLRLQQEYRHKLTALQEEQQLQLATVKSTYQQQVDQLHQHYRMQQGQFKEAIESAKNVIREEKRRNQMLKDKLDNQADEFQRTREALHQEVAHERESAQERGQQQVQQQFDIELKARVEQASAELKEMLDMREVELFYREEQLGTLREEIARLRQDRERLVGQGGDRLLQHLVENGVAFVAYQPGVEAMTIPFMDIPRYLESPLDYVAEKCTVTPQQYQEWLNHYELPVCAATKADGARCGELVEKIERPHQFLPGRSDRCAIHRDAEQIPPRVAHKLGNN
ncbi:MAG: hypothetical protein JWM78_3196 [Verrucomicrobiaceae bacterium]|nr:hypothetical protein [Verrucomicrobiaceae bacterium]